MKLATVLAEVEPGDDDWSWRSQFKWLEENRVTELEHLKEDMWLFGQRTPIHIGIDGRLWDGHHRLWCAVKLNWDDIDVKDDRPNM